jgi:hypothetical protein
MCPSPLAVLGPDWATAVFTGVLTLATILLWWQTKKSADAATKAANAAKQSADLELVASGAYIAVTELSCIGEVPPSGHTPDTVKWTMLAKVKNHGRTPAKDVRISGAVYFGKSRTVIQDLPCRGPFHISPGAEMLMPFVISMSTSERTTIAGFGGQLEVKVRADYKSPAIREQCSYDETFVQSLQKPVCPAPGSPESFRFQFPIIFAPTLSDTTSGPG